MTTKFPNLMPFQELPFNGDKYMEAEFLRLKKLYGIKTIVELGTCIGSSTLWMGQHFELTHTVEINKQFHEIAEKRFIENTYLFKNHTVANWFGDSVKVLPKLFAHGNLRVNPPFMVFIDSHWENNVPLLEELKIIAESGHRPVIVIHDFQVPGKPEFGFDSYHGQPFTWQWIEPSIEKIYGKSYEYHYNEKAIGAKRGVVYICPTEISNHS